MNIDITIRPPGSFVVVTDDEYTDMPDFVDSKNRIWSNRWCIGIGTRCDADGETRLHVSDQEREVSGNLAYDGYIESPSRKVTVSDAYLNEFACVYVQGNKAHVKVYTDHPSEPDEIYIMIL